MKIVCSELSNNIYTGEVKLVNEHGVYCALSDEFKDIPRFCYSIEVAECAEDVEDLANYYELYSTKWQVFADTAKLTRLIGADASGNVQYLLAYKADTKSTKASSLSDQELIDELERRGYVINTM